MITTIGIFFYGFILTPLRALMVMLRCDPMDMRFRAGKRGSYFKQMCREKDSGEALNSAAPDTIYPLW